MQPPQSDPSTSPPNALPGLEAVNGAVVAACTRAGRDARSVELIAVSKFVPVEIVKFAIASGQHVYGESRVQEALLKWSPLREEFTGLRLHLIGPLQTNKVRSAVALFDVIQSLDRPSLAEALARECDKQARRPQLFIQVNTGLEPQKAGIVPDDTDAFVAACRNDYGLQLSGLMCIPPVDEPPQPHFALLAQLAARNGLTGLSMGMSSDFELAIELGATHIRVGTAIFGSRPGPREMPTSA